VQITGINDLGQMVGWYQDTGNALHGLVVSNGIYNIFEEPLAGVGRTVAAGINNKGLLVGTFYADRSYDGYIKYGNNLTVLQAPNADNYTSALGINDSGAVVGYYVSNNVDYGFEYVNGVYTTLTFPSANSGTVATGISNDGTIVGYYYDAQNNSHGFVEKNGVYTALDLSAVANGMVSDVQASGISNTDYIVGYFTDRTGVHGFVASPVPLPGAGALFGFAALALSGVSRGRRSVGGR
jgi:probable HAF family extracellular repeat protein